MAYKPPNPSTSKDPAVNPNAAGPPAPAKPKPAASKKGGGLNLGPAPAAPPNTKNLSTGAAFNAFINAHPLMRDYSDQIWKWAHTYGVDPVVMASLFWRESFAAAKASGQDPRTIVSPAGAVGIGQIMPLHVGEKTPWGHVISQTDLTNPKFNIRWSTYYFSTFVEKYGDYDQAYAGQPGTKAGGYNHGYTGPALTSLLPHGYVPRSGLSPTDQGTVTAETAAATASAKAQTFDKWAVLQNGQVKFVTITDTAKPPKNTLMYAGSPLTQSSFNQVWSQTYADTFQAYTGRTATGAEMKSILATAPSIYTLSNQLANEPGFSKSPVFKQHAPGLIGLAQSVLGNNWKPSGGIIRQAIAQNWDQATFMQHVRKLPAYQNGPEFKTNLAQNQAAYEQIYGKATGDPAVMQAIKARTAAGWTPDQLQAWLRAQPAYQQSSEFHAKMLSLASQLGLITGAVPTLTADQVDQMLADNPFPAQATGPGGAPNRPDNKPGPRGANPGGASPPVYPTPVRPDDRAGIRGAGR